MSLGMNFPIRPGIIFKEWIEAIHPMLSNFHPQRVELTKDVDGYYDLLFTFPTFQLLLEDEGGHQRKVDDIKLSGVDDDGDWVQLEGSLDDDLNGLSFYLMEKEKHENARRNPMKDNEKKSIKRSVKKSG